MKVLPVWREKIARTVDARVKARVRVASMPDLATLDQDTEEICCPTCRSWTNEDDLIGDDIDPAKCPLCAREGMI